MRNIALRLMYNGTNYHGWQVQKTHATVAETLEKALSAICKEKIKVTGCGRTDAGVHAERYIANFRTQAGIPCDRLPLPEKGVHLPDLQLPDQKSLLRPPGLLLPQAAG